MPFSGCAALNRTHPKITPRPFIAEKLSLAKVIKSKGGRRDIPRVLTFQRGHMKFRVGDWVEVRSKEDILRSLDKKGQLEGMPFMPQMFQYCGQRLKVYKRAHKTCDTVFPIRGRRVSNAVHLDLRCDGEAYGGCQAACLIFWKTAWLKPASIQGAPIGPFSRTEPLSTDSPGICASCTEADVYAGTITGDQKSTDGPRYICQATQLPYFTTALPWWDIRQYLEDFTSGNVTLGQLIRGLIYASYYNLSRFGIGLGRPLRWLYDMFQSLWGGIPYPRRNGTIPADQHTPVGTLNLQAGELVQVKSYKEILATLNTENKNRGLYFDAEAVPYCGGIHKVRTRLNKFIDEKTGRLVTLKTSSIILEDAWCRSRYSDCRMFCPRSIYSWWREIWLERVSESPDRGPRRYTEKSS